MNDSNVSGKLDQLVGKVKQGVGEALGDQSLANRGAAQEVKGDAKETWGDVKDAAGDVHDRASASAAARADHDSAVTASKAHDTRESVTSSAASAKDKIEGKIDEFRQKHNL